MRDTGSPAAGYEGSWLSSCRDVEEQCIYTLSDILICHFHQSSSSDVLSDVSICRFHQSPFICCILLLYSVILLCHSLFYHIYLFLPTSSYYIVCFCRVPQSYASVIFTWHSETAIYNPFVIALCHFLVSFSCHVVFIWHSMSICYFDYIILFCH